MQLSICYNIYYPPFLRLSMVNNGYAINIQNMEINCNVFPVS